MTPRERIWSALQHKEPDQVPYDLGSTQVTSIHRIAYRNLLQHLGMEQALEKELRIFDRAQQLPYLDEDLLVRCHADVRGLAPQGPDCPEVEADGRRSFTDAYGITWTMPKDGLYYDMTSHPLSELTLTDEAVDQLPLPQPEALTQVAGLREKGERIHRESDQAMIAIILSGGIFEQSFWVRGFKNFYLDLARHPSQACGLMDRLMELRLACWEIILEEVGDLIQVVMEADDLATQQSLMTSPEMYRKYVKPRHRRITSFIKQTAPGPIHIFFHSCGSVYDLIPDLIEAGFDILNPVQVSAAKMDTKQLKKQFGKDLTFWGGGVDTQHVLPHGTPAEVKDEVKRRIDDLAPGGGFVFSTVHNIQADVPPENIVAMWEALQEYGKY